jgi:hypothetical protein
MSTFNSSRVPPPWERSENWYRSPAALKAGRSIGPDQSPPPSVERARLRPDGSVELRTTGRPAGCVTEIWVRGATSDDPGQSPTIRMTAFESVLTKAQLDAISFTPGSYLVVRYVNHNGNYRVPSPAISTLPRTTEQHREARRQAEALGMSPADYAGPELRYLE